MPGERFLTVKVQVPARKSKGETERRRLAVLAHRAYLASLKGGNRGQG